MIATGSGLLYRVIEEGSGSGKTPKASTPCECHYKGTTIDGSEFDSSYKRGKPTTFAPNQVIKGWTEAMQLMKEGDTWELYVERTLLLLLLLVLLPLLGCATAAPATFALPPTCCHYSSTAAAANTHSLTHSLTHPASLRYIPSELAYGSRGAGGKIGPDAVLVFTLNLITVKGPSKDL